MSKRNAKYHTSHAKPSRPKSKITAVSQNKAFQNFKSNCNKYCDDRWHPQPPLMSTHICQRFRSLQKFPSANALGPCRNSHACHRMKKCPMACTCHAKQRFRPQKCPGCLTCAMKNWHSSKNEHRALIKVDLGKWAKRETCFVRLRACAVEMDMDISQGNFCASLRGQRPKIRASTLIKTRPVRLLRDSLSAGMLWGESSIPHACESSCITCIRLERKAGF